MSASKNIDKICAVITLIAVLVTVIFMNGSAIGIKADDSVSLGYADTLFDDSYVHTIDITIDDWDAFLEKATSEEYVNADVTIDGETVKNVGIRGKGNTSLSTVSQLDSERYSFKIEFDCYESSGNYKGLDKLCLNNLIQDYTMMKDYIAYKLMNEFGADAPLASYCFITVNGEDWGMYLAVEAVEDSFLQRNYGTNYGDLYKPDSMSMGGGRGNGGGFDMRDMDFSAMGMDNPFERGSQGFGGPPEGFDGEMPEGFPGGFPGGDSDENGGFPGGPPGDFPGMSEKDDTEQADTQDSDSKAGKSSGENKDRKRPERSESAEGSSEKNAAGSVSENGRRGPGGKGGFSGGGPGGGPGGGGPGMGSDDAKLKYIDDEIDSYSAIFDSAKTDVKKSDKKRLIKSLKNLNEGIENSDADLISEAVNVDEVMRYMVVHNFVVNGDSYTGNMIHNYYLYEDNGLMSMIPWDYNLAFGTFQGQDATGIVNDPIDTPQSVTEDSNDRPMFSWITSTDEYTQLYHEYYSEFIEKFYSSGYLTDLINNTYEMISDYVDRDPTKFCTTEEFEKGVQTILKFVELRCQSIEGQLNGTIPSTDAGQEEDSTSLIDASDITLSDMGSMGGGGGPGHGDGSSVSRRETETPAEGINGFPGQEGSFSGTSTTDRSDLGQDASEDNQGETGETVGTSLSENKAGGMGGFPGNPPDGMGTPPGGMGGFPGQGGSFSSISKTDYIYTGISALVLAAAILFAYMFRRTKEPFLCPDRVIQK